MVCIISPEGIVYGGVDESNHGSSPEFFSLVLSGYNKDVIKATHKIPKAKKCSKVADVLSKVKKRGHTFLQVRRKDYSRLHRSQLIGKIVASLCEDFLPSELERFELFIDGKLSSSEKMYARELLADIYGFSKKQVIIKCGGKFDRYYPIVNYADCMARYYFNLKISAKKLPKKKNLRELQYFV